MCSPSFQVFAMFHLNATRPDDSRGWGLLSNSFQRQRIHEKGYMIGPIILVKHPTSNRISYTGTSDEINANWGQSDMSVFYSTIRHL